MGADGVYARTGLYEGVVDALTAMITRYRHPRAEVFRFPPVMSRKMIETSGYLKSFPNLLGCMCCLQGLRSRNPRLGRPLRRRRGRALDRRPFRRRPRPDPRLLLPRSTPSPPLAARCRPRACCSTWPATASAASLRKTSTACNPSACASMSASARQSRSPPSARTGSSAPRASPTGWAFPTPSISPTTPSSGAAAS